MCCCNKSISCLRNEDDICRASSYSTNLKTITSELITKEILVLVSFILIFTCVQKKIVNNVSYEAIADIPWLFCLFNAGNFKLPNSLFQNMTMEHIQCKGDCL